MKLAHILKNPPWVLSGGPNNRIKTPSYIKNRGLDLRTNGGSRKTRIDTGLEPESEECEKKLSGGYPKNK
jgi:hypothetical protein